jgi:hypothetical protein
VSWVERTPVRIGGYVSRVYQRKVDDGHLTVFVGREPLGPNGSLRWHMSLAHNRSMVGPGGGAIPGRIPTWDEIKEARYAFCPDDSYMAMILPPKKEYVNVHPTTMHLHEMEEV